MIVTIKPKIDSKLKIMFDKLLSTTDKTLPLHFKFLKNLTVELREQFMQYFSYTTKYDLKEYNLLHRKYKNNENMLIDAILDMVTDYKDSAVWKTNHLEKMRGIYLGSMYQIKYKNYHHDPFPLVIFLNSYDVNHQNFQAINLHYFFPQYRDYLITQILRINQPRIKSGKEPILTLPIVNKLIPSVGMAYRNYKAEEIKVIERISYTRWKTYLQIDHRQVIL
jgi:hypothetical protein